MSRLAVSPRWVCPKPACGHIHLAWSPRCLRKGCNALGLTLASSSEPSNSEVPKVEVAVADPIAAKEDAKPLPLTPFRPRLVIARDRTPEPELTDPDEELADVLTPTDGPVPITDVEEATFVRMQTGLAPLDHVLGGGLVVGSVVLLASPRGVGKSSLSLQMLAGLDRQCLYVSGEETVAQVAATARRINAATPSLHVLVERHLSTIFSHARKMRAQVMVIDSIQKMLCAEVNGRAGSPAQVKECSSQLVDFAKTTETALWIIGHVTGEGAIAGPQTIEHDVDVVLELTAGMKLMGTERILRCLGKNRFGPSENVGSFELTPEGLKPIDADDWNAPF